MSKTLAKVATLDGNSAVAKVAYHMSETAFIFPITPSTPMGEMADAWSVQGKKNAFGDTLTIRQMQSEAGVAGAVHGSCVNGSITSTFTSSQGLLLMIPNMFKIAGELNPCVFHVPARSIGGQAANIFNDHTDVMTAARPSGFAMLNSTDVQEAHDLALIAHVASLKASLPFLHFFDGMRTSHEIQKISVIPEAVMDEMVPHDAIAAFRKKSTHPEHPTYRGTLQGPDTYMQGVERGEEYYRKLPGIVQAAMDEFAEKTGRHYHLFDYVGHPKADKVVVVLGSAACAAEEAVDALNARGQKVGLVKVRLFRPFDADAFMASLPKSVKSIAVLDRVKEAGAFAQPLFGEVSAAIQLAEKKCTTVGGRFGLGGRDTSPADIMAVFKHLEQKKPAHNFTVGINDDICHTNLARYPEEIDCVPEGTVQCMFWGLGSDGTVGANKSAIKTLGENTDLYAQGYFSYDAKKSGGITISHLRFGPKPIKSAYMIRTADYVACHQPSYMGRYGPQIVRPLRERGTFVLNAPWKTVEELEAHIPADVRRTLAEKNAQFFVVDAAALAESVGLTGRVNNIMQAAFYQLANVLPIEEAISLLKGDIEKSFKIKGQDVVERNWKAVDAALGGLVKVDIPEHWRKAEASEDTVHGIEDPFADTPEDTEFFRTVARPIQRMQGASLPVSIMPEGGQIPNGSSKYEKRSIAYTIPIWNPDNCIQCNLCSLSCPHAAIRPYLLTQEQADAAPEGFTTINAKPKKLGAQFRIQPSPLDCVGCGLCIEQCPADALSFDLLDKVKEEQKKLYAYANDLPLREDAMDKFSVKGSQFQKPLVAQVSMADPAHMLRCLKEAESFPGPSLINYLSPCIGWGVAGGLAKNVETAKHMVAAGMWNLWSYDPRKGDTTADRVEIASEPTFDLETVMNEQLRFHTLKGAHRDELVAALEKDVRKKWGKLQALKEMQV
ncbi:Pyruvate-flavodoxin oxidoreductase [Carpediemonas membranifera]|uniref:pyruvate dehydrogenase (NADP(+)) n=1 Tax=Carpediemonas membranifera TaxID=201153 RepID=A0A8J6E6X2_9EUKA|nr:Pyruvate-flavodoxin oxidoreductase [Carpediemonas membranifera]|eukprot:KAG9390025.1 Pyruvate-flavodoxin oxidoreductase [Carpediemonas membranifera]